MKLDLRPRCKRCNKIPRSKNEKDNHATRYAGYCSFHCQEWHRLEEAQRYLNARAEFNGGPSHG